jgi:serine/threonine protein kinase
MGNMCSSRSVPPPANSSSPGKASLQPSPDLPSRPARHNNRIVAKLVGSINEHFHVLKEIGTNSFGTMLYSQELQSGNFRVIREVNKSIINEYGNVKQEVEILSSLDHPNIEKIYETIETAINYYLVYEYLNGGTLRNKMRRSGNEISLAKVMHHVFSAVKYMHLNGVMHLDLTPNHILFADDGENQSAKLISFSYAQRISEPQLLDLKNLNYIYTAPDVLRKDFTEKADIWSLGIIIYELLVGKHPYLSKDKHDIIKEIYAGNIDFDNTGFTQLSYNGQDFIRKALSSDPSARISATQALEHPWLELATEEYCLAAEVLLKLRNFKVIHK